jgi:hypothetical protein
LQETYEEKEGKTVGRYQVYDDYLEFCAKAGHLPTNNAALGKIFKVHTIPRGMVRPCDRKKRSDEKLWHGIIAPSS